MQFITLFLLTGCLSLTTADKEAVEQLRKDVERFLQHGEGNPIDSKNHKLTLLNKCLGTTNKTLIWKALIDDKKNVAVKLFTDMACLNQEIAAYQALLAIQNDEVEEIGIPQVYYVGKIFGRVPIIVMTLFDECLDARWIAQGKKFTKYTTLQVFLQSVRILKYFNERNVLHNDIKPQNIFLRGEKVFIGDFDMASLNGESNSGCTELFASSRKWENQSRNAMDDLESLVYSIWYIEGINSWQPDGFMIFNQTPKQNKVFVTEKCKHFKNFPATQSACLFICKDEMLSGKSIPAYDKIIGHLKAALSEVKEITQQTKFEWPTPSSRSPSRSPSSSKLKSTISKVLSFNRK